MKSLQRALVAEKGKRKLNGKWSLSGTIERSGNFYRTLDCYGCTRYSATVWEVVIYFSTGKGEDCEVFIKQGGNTKSMIPSLHKRFFFCVRADFLFVFKS